MLYLTVFIFLLGTRQLSFMAVCRIFLLCSQGYCSDCYLFNLHTGFIEMYVRTTGVGVFGFSGTLERVLFILKTAE